MAHTYLCVVSVVAALCWGCTLQAVTTGLSHAPQSSRTPAGVSIEDTCVGKPESSACWIELTNRPGCFVWTFVYGGDGEKVTWTGACQGGIAQGLGTLTWVWGNDQEFWAVDRGVLVDGRPHGHWLIHEKNGDEEMGPYVHGKREGQYIIRFTNGDVSEGMMVDDEKNGEWVTRRADGTVEKHNYVNGEIK